MSVVTLVIYSGLLNGNVAMAGVRFLAGVRDFALLHTVQTGSGAHPASHPMDTVGRVADHLSVVPR
jgi:hypothetical protein